MSTQQQIPKGVIALLLAILTLNTSIINAQESDTLFGNWRGLKDTLEESGITAEASIIGDAMGVVSGGLDKGVTQVFLYQLGTEIDTEKAGLWKDGTFLFSAIGITGGPLYDRTGDFQFADNIDGYGVDTFTLYEAWYEHSFMDGDLTLLTGLHEYNSEFYALDYAYALINSSFAFGPELSQIGNSTYPITALTARVRIQPSENSYAMFAVYDGVPGNPNNLQGTQVILNKNDGVFYAAEAGITSSEEDTETDYFKLALGAWHRTTDFTDYQERQRADTSGGYLIGERKIYNEGDSTQGLGAFFQAGVTQGDRYFIAQYFGAGLHYTGLFTGRDEDITAIGIAQARTGSAYTDFDTNAVSAETAYEISYRAALGHGISIQPDIQYISNPGLSKDLSHALVVGTRLEVSF